MIELLIAVAIAGVSVVLIFGVYSALTRSVHSTTTRSARAAEVAAALESLRADLVAIARPGPELESIFRCIGDADSGLHSVSLVRAVPPADPEVSLAEHALADVSYRVEGPGAGALRLVRSARLQTTEGAPETLTHTVLSRAQRIRLLLMDEQGAWTGRWDAEGHLPSAFRVEIAWADGAATTLSIDGVIPAAQLFRRARTDPPTTR